MGIQINGQTDTVTATDGSINVGGDVTIPGILTYEDVTNVDSVGVITARDNVHVTNGSVAIGHNNPTSKLHISVPNGTGQNGGIILQETGNQEHRIYVDNAHQYNAINSSSGTWTWDSNGVVAKLTTAGLGIGTDNPVSKLELWNNSNIEVLRLRDTHFNKYLTIRGGGSPNRMIIDSYEGSGGGADIDLASNGSTKVRIKSDGKIGVGVASPQQKLDVVGSAHTVAVFRPDINTTSTYGDASVVNNLINLRMPYGSNPGSATNNGARWGIKFQGRNDGNEYGTDAGKSASIYAVSEDATAGYNRQVGLAFYTSGFDANQTERMRITSAGQLNLAGNMQFTAATPELEFNNGGPRFRVPAANTLTIHTGGGLGATSNERLRITSTGDVNIPGGILNLGTIGQHSAHINSPELMSFNIDTDNDDTNRYFIFRTNAGTNAGTELMRLTEGGNLGIGGQDPGTGDGGNSNYNNWDIPKLHVRGSSSSGKFHLLGRFHAGNDADGTGAQIVIHHENDRGMALQGGRSSGNRSYGAIKSLDNLARESNVMVFTGGTGQGVENIKFYTNGNSTGTNERMLINTHGTIHTGGSTEITQTSLKPDLITQAGVISPLFWRPFGGLTGAPSTSGPGYKDFGTGGVRHNLVDPHMGSGLGGSQFQGGLINSYGQTFSNTATGTTREAINWNRFRILFRGLCPSSGYSVATVKFRYSTYHYSNGWQDHAGTEWTYTGTESERGARWVVGPWINPSSYFTNWADVPGFGLYYNDNSSGRNFRIAGGVYYQYAYFQ